LAKAGGIGAKSYPESSNRKVETDFARSAEA